jgi:hypothetical protein
MTNNSFVYDEGHKVLTINKMTFGPYEVIIYITNIIIGHRKQMNYLSSFIPVPYFVIIFWFFYFTNEVSSMTNRILKIYE